MFLFLVLYHKRYLMYFGEEVMHKFQETETEDVPSFVDSILLVLRYFLQLLRLLLILRRSRYAMELRRQMSPVDIIGSVEDEEGATETDTDGLEGINSFSHHSSSTLTRREPNFSTDKEGDGLLA
mmetsp:Transcript_43930/g.85923  ORF Transcript_43930/g.85923 Transcript_43930/m.85923 type:complete len:125 (+) Transcript_43930:451-825(+)